MIRVGLFQERNGPSYPPLSEQIGHPIQHKAEVVRYLRTRGKTRLSAPGIMRDVFTGDQIREPMAVYTDGSYEWSSDVAYYVEQYDMTLPDVFIDHIIKTGK